MKKIIRQLYIHLFNVKHALERIRDMHSGSFRFTARDGIDELDNAVEQVEKIENGLSTMQEKTP